MLSFALLLPVAHARGPAQPPDVALLSGRPEHAQDPVPYISGQFGEFGDICHDSGSSKCTLYFHAGYQRVYPEFMDPVRSEKMKFCEVGLKDGESYNLWHNYLPSAELHGIEIAATDEVKAQAADKGLTLHVGDQEDKTFLQQFIQASRGAFDIFVDDGGHAWAQQINTFEVLFPGALKPGGLFVIEDIETSYWNPSENLYGTPIKGKTPASQSLVEFMIGMANSAGGNGNDVQSISSAENVFFIRKKGGPIWPADNFAELCGAEKLDFCSHAEDMHLLMQPHKEKEDVRVLHTTVKSGSLSIKGATHTSDSSNVTSMRSRLATARAQEQEQGGEATTTGVQFFVEYLGAGTTYSNEMEDGEQYDILIDKGTTPEQFTKLLVATRPGGIIMMLEPASETREAMKKMVHVVNRKFYDNGFTVFSEQDRHVKYVGFANNMVMIRRRVEADYIFNQPYVWKQKLAGPAAQQVSVP